MALDHASVEKDPAPPAAGHDRARRPSQSRGRSAHRRAAGLAIVCRGAARHRTPHVIGVIHADRGRGETIDVLEREVLWEFATGLAQAYEERQPAPRAAARARADAPVPGMDRSPFGRAERRPDHAALAADAVRFPPTETFDGPAPRRAATTGSCSPACSPGASLTCSACSPTAPPSDRRCPGPVRCHREVPRQPDSAQAPRLQRRRPCWHPGPARPPTALVRTLPTRMRSCAPGQRIGQRIRRREDPRFLLAKVSTSMTLISRRARINFVRSPWAHARIISVDGSARPPVGRRPRVERPQTSTCRRFPRPRSPRARSQYLRPVPWLRKRCRFAGDIVAVVLAPTREAGPRCRRAGRGRVRPAARSGTDPVRAVAMRCCCSRERATNICVKRDL